MPRSTVNVLKLETFKTMLKNVPDKKLRPKTNRAPKNENFKIMFWPFRTTGHTWFGRGSHQRWGLNRLKKVSYKQKNVLRHEKFSKNRHNSVSRPSLGMSSVAKWIIFHGGIFLNPQNSRGRPGGSNLGGAWGGALGWGHAGIIIMLKESDAATSAISFLFWFMVVLASAYAI